MAKFKQPPIPAKMYRQFAVVTVGLTAILALIAQGENKHFYEEQMEAPQAQQASSKSAFAAKDEEEERKARSEARRTAPAYGEASLTRRDGAQGGGFGDGEFDASYGRPSGPQSSRYSSIVVPDSGSENAVFAASHLDKLSEEELERILAALREDGIETAIERRQALALIEASSRRRSGHRYN